MIFLKWFAISSCFCGVVFAQVRIEPVTMPPVTLPPQPLYTIVDHNDLMLLIDRLDLATRNLSFVEAIPDPRSPMVRSLASLETENDTLMKTIKAMVNNDEKWMNRYLIDEKKQATTVLQQIQYRKKAIEVLKGHANNGDRSKK